MIKAVFYSDSCILTSDFCGGTACRARSKMEGISLEKEIPTAREAALRALFRVEKDGAYLNLVLPPLAGTLPPRERALAVQLASGTIRRLNTLDWALSLYLNKPLASLTPWIRNLLRLGAYQLFYLDRVPAHAAVDEAVRLARRFGHRGVAGLVNAVLRKVAAAGGSLPWPSKKARPQAYLSLYYSFPEWLVERWVKRFGPAEAEALCQAANEPPPVSLRPNRLRIAPEPLQEILAREGVTAAFSPRLPGMLRTRPHRSPAGLASFQAGLFTVQGESSSLAAPLLGPRPGERVLDFCSAPGGKATHLAELMEDSGRVTAVDIHRSRLALVEKAARRLGLSCIETVAADGRQIHRCGLPAPDRILVDAPCSGLGVIGRLPELKWRRRAEELPGMRRLQLSLLEAAAALLRPGGKLLYSVCSNEPEETAAVARSFTARNPAFSLQPEYAALPENLAGAVTRAGPIELFPHRHGLDGFFFALWQKRRG